MRALQLAGVLTLLLSWQPAAWADDPVPLPPQCPNCTPQIPPMPPPPPPPPPQEPPSPTSGAR